MIYEHAFSTIDPNASGEVSVNMLVKVLETSALSAAMIDQEGLQCRISSECNRSSTSSDGRGVFPFLPHATHSCNFANFAPHLVICSSV